MKLTKHHIAGLTGIGIVCLLSWCMGFDFNERGVMAFGTALTSLIVGFMFIAASYSK